MIDPFGRAITYLRISVTDRCDFRCQYCMAEDMAFLARDEILSFEELDQIVTAFVKRGVTKVRMTGGEPLVRRGVMSLFEKLGRFRKSGELKELTLTSNASQLERFADELPGYGVERINISLDTLNADNFATLTRRGKLNDVLNGIKAAKKAGLKIKINAVALKGVNDTEFDALVRWCGDEGFDLTLIETMPLGDIGAQRTDHYLPLSEVREQLEQNWSLTDTTHFTGGPSRYVDVAETGQRIGFITPLSNHFCDTCNRVRLTCTGTLYMCLGQEGAVDLRTPLRQDPTGKALEAAIDLAISLKPRGHDFVIAPGQTAPSVKRHMSVTGG